MIHLYFRKNHWFFRKWGVCVHINQSIYLFIYLFTFPIISALRIKWLYQILNFHFTLSKLAAFTVEEELKDLNYQFQSIKKHPTFCDFFKLESQFLNVSVGKQYNKTTRTWPCCPMTFLHCKRLHIESYILSIIDIRRERGYAILWNTCTYFQLKHNIMFIVI